ncbi:MAG: hypothetical protein ACLP8X_06770, partial [Streptosporangiaceae bacterium]
AGDDASPAASRPPGSRQYRRGSVPAKPPGTATSAARPRSRSNGRPPAAAAAAAEGLSEPVVSGPAVSGPAVSGPAVLDAESAEGELSAPVWLGSAPPRIASPEQGKPTHLARSRYHIALCAIALLAFVVVASFVTLWLGRNIDNLTRLLEIIFAPIIAVVAAAVAFYYRGSSL